MPSGRSASCVSPRSQWLRVSPKPRFCICARWWLACAWLTASSIRPSASWMSSARLWGKAPPGPPAPRDAAILSSLPGIGTVTLATLLSEAAGPISRRDYAALRTLSGVAPVTKRSGKSCIVTMRYAAQVRLRNAVFHWARVAALNDPTCRSRYAALRARGHSYGRALRSVADRLLGMACVLLQRQVLFDPDYGSSTAA